MATRDGISDSAGTAATAAATAQAAANAAQATADAATLRARYAIAKIQRVHMESDNDDLITAGALASTDSLATAGARFTAWRTAWLNHLASGGASPFFLGSHLLADAVNTGIGTDVSSLPNLITRIGEAKASIIGHGNQAGVHFNPDTGTSGTGFILPVDPPVTQADANSDINAIVTASNSHIVLASN